MQRIRLTERIVQTATAAEGRDKYLWDASVDGLGLRVRSPSGRKTWVLDYHTQGGRRRRITLGSPPAWPVGRARREATARLAEIMGGSDPLEERRKVRAAVTFAELAERYLDRHARRWKKTWREDQRVIQSDLLPIWGRRKAEGIDRRDVASLHADLGARGEYSANRALALVSAIFSWGERMGELPDNYPNPARRVTRFKERSRDRWLSEEEVRRVMAAVEAESNIYVRGYFWLAVLLGTRKGELLSLRWADVDPDRATLRLPETKAGRPHSLTLSRPALNVLRALPHEAGCPYVFSGRYEGEHLSVAAIDQAWRRCRAAAGVPDARLHDLRRTVGSWMAQSGATLHLVGKVLNHRTTTTTAIYARLADESMRTALDAHAARVVAAAGVPVLIAPTAPGGEV